MELIGLAWTVVLIGAVLVLGVAVIREGFTGGR